MRDWVHQAVHRIEADFQRSADTHLFRLEVPGLDGIDIYLKDESTHPTGSLKHRQARTLFLYALCYGKVRQGQTVIEASSGSTAVSESYFARMLGLRFIAVMPQTTAQSKIDMIRFYGGECHFVSSAPEMHDAAVALAGFQVGVLGEAGQGHEQANVAFAQHGHETAQAHHIDLG